MSIAPGAPRAGSPVALTASSRGRGLVFAWDLDNDGGFDDATGASVAHTFPAAGEAVVRVQASDEDGRVAGALRRVDVHTENRRPTASITAPGSARVGREIASLAFGSDPDGLIDGVELDLDGDGTFELTRPNGSAAPVTFASAGVKTVRARVTDDAGATAVSTATIDVHGDNFDPFVSLSHAPAAPRPGAAIQLSAFATDLDGSISNYEFDLDGDGSYELDRDAISTATVSFADAGLHVVGVRATDNDGAVATARAGLTVKAGDDPPAVTLSRVAAPGAPTFSALAFDEDGQVVEYAWDLDNDAVFDDLVGPSESIAQLGTTVAGTYEIGVRVTDDGGNATTRRRAVTIRDVAARVPTINIFQQQPRVGESVSFFADFSFFTTDPDVTYAWDLDGDGAFDDATGGFFVSFRYPTAGEYEVAVRVTATNGSTAVGTALVNVSPATGNRVPGADFSSTPAAPRTGATVTFSDTSVDSDGEPPPPPTARSVVDRAWDLDGDGQFDDATSTSPSTTFAVAGVHRVALRVTDDDGASAVQRRTIEVHDGNLPPRATLTTSTTEVQTGQTVSVSAFGNGIDDAISEYAWDLDDDGAFDDAVGQFQTSASTSFATAGPHRVRVRVTDQGGLTDVETLLFEARVPGPNRAPRVSIGTTVGSPFGTQAAARVGRPASFFASASDPDGDPPTVQWDLDEDGAFDDATGTFATTSFDTPGVKTIRAQVADGRGGTGEDVTTLQVRATNIPPAISSFSVAQPRVGRATLLSAFAFDPDDTSPLVLTWDLDGDGEFDDTPDSGSEFGFVYFWTPPSTDPVTIGVRATDADGAAATRTLEVTPSATNLPPSVSIFSFFGTTPAAGGQLSLNAFANDPDGSCEVFFIFCTSRVELAWDLDADGSFDDAGGPFASLPVPTQGAYTIAVRATDEDGATATDSQTFRVGSRPPLAAFTISNQTPEQGTSVTLTSTASDPDGTIDSRSWDLDDDGAFDDATGTTASVTFPAAGQRRVGHKVRDADGDNGIEYKVIDVRSTENPVASFTREPASPLVGETITFTSTSTDPQGAVDIATQQWDLDDDGAFDDATGASASRSYDAAGTNAVALRVTDQGGHVDEVRVTFVVRENAPPAASFTRSPLTGTVGEQVTFTSTSTDSDGTIATLEWDLDDDGAFDDASGADAARTYDTSGAKTVRLRVTDNNGSSASAVQSFDVVTGEPVARFGVTPSSPGAGQLVTFTSSSVDADGTIASQAWDLDDDGEFDDATTPVATRTFDSAGDYVIRLRVTDDDGRTATSTQTVRVRPDNLAPRVSLSATRATPRTGQEVRFTASAADRDGDAITEYAFDLDGDDDFEGGADQIGTAGEATTSFATAGEIVVRVRATDARGATATDEVTLDVRSGDQLPVVFAYPDSARKRRPAGGGGATFTFTGSAWDPDDALYDPQTGVYDDGITLWEWDVNGDGDYGDPSDGAGPDLRTITATLGVDGPGVHTVNLRVTGAGGAAAVHALTVETYDGNSAPTAFVYHWPFEVQRNVPVNFEAYAYDSDGDPVTFAWDLDGDGAFDDASGERATQTFTERGRKTVKLRATDNASPAASTDVEYSVDVTGARPLVTIDASPFAPETGQEVTLTADATDPDGSIASYAWDLDGDYDYDDATGATAMRTYALGSHQVGVRVTDNDGDSTVARRQVVVHQPIQLPGGGDAGVGTPDPAVTDAAGNQLPSSATVDPATGRVTVSVTRGTVGQQPGGCAALDLEFPIRGAARNVIVIVRRAGLADIRRAATAVRDEAGVPTGMWRVHIDCLERADLLVEYDLPDPGGGPDDHIGPVLVGGIVLIDPQGVVYDRQRYDEELASVVGTPTAAQQEAARAAAAIENATVTLQRFTAGAWANVNPDDPGISPNVNPQSTNSEGLYRWDVSEGTYRVLVSKPGYTAVTSDSAVIPPPKLDLHVPLERNNAPVAGFDVVGTPTAGAAATYRSTASVLNGALVEQKWDLDGDGEYDDASGPEVSHTFATAGSKPIGLRVVDADGEAAVATRAVGVAEPLGASGGVVTPPVQPPVVRPPVVRPPVVRPPVKALTVSVAPKPGKLRSVLGDGLAVTIACSIACQTTITATVDSATAKRLKLGGTRQVGTLVRTLTAGKATTLRLKLAPKVRTRARRMRSLKLSLRIVLLGSQGQRREVIRTVNLKR